MIDIGETQIIYQCYVCLHLQREEVERAEAFWVQYEGCHIDLQKLDAAERFSRSYGQEG